MRKLLLLLAGVLSNLLVQAQTQDRTPCHALTVSCTALPFTPCTPSVYHPAPYILTDVSVPIEQYLARGMDLRHLVNKYESNPTSVNTELDTIVALRPAILYRASGIWANESAYSFANYLKTLRCFVDNVNARYDCAGYRRPLIQAAIYTEEVGDNGELETLQNGSPCVPIDVRAISEFTDEIVAAGQVSSYFSSFNYSTQTGVPKTTAAYYTPSMQTNNILDIESLQARMWVYQQAVMYLDAGYNALDMGQAGRFAKLSIPLVINSSGALSYTPAIPGNPASLNLQNQQQAQNARLLLLDKLIRRIRSYAQSVKSITNLPITAEPVGNSVDRKTIKYITGRVNGVDQLIFDYVEAAMRARETKSNYTLVQIDTRDRTSPTYACGPEGSDLATRFDGTGNCSGQLQATVDMCHGFDMTPDGGGVTPAGRVFTGATPYYIYFDSTDGWVYKPDGDGHAGVRGQFYKGNEGVYGYDDVRWFTAGLNNGQCRGYWMSIELKRVRSFIESKSFLSVLGHLPAGSGTDGKTPPVETFNFPEYKLATDSYAPGFINTAWKVANPAFVLSNAPCGGVITTGCGQSGSNMYNIFPKLTMSVQNPDVTSIYTWHIQNTTTGNWEAMTYGSYREFKPTSSGNYAIYMKQDNLGLPNGATSRTYQLLGATIPVGLTCCPYPGRPAQPTMVLMDPDKAAAVFASEAAQGVRVEDSTPMSNEMAQALATAQLQQQAMAVELFPQPSSDLATIQLTTDAPVKVSGTVVDVLGKQVLTVPAATYASAGKHLLELNVKALSSGVYTCRLLINGQAHNLKLVKN